MKTLKPKNILISSLDSKTNSDLIPVAMQCIPATSASKFGTNTGLSHFTSSLLMSSLEKVRPGIRPLFFSQKIAAKEPEKKIPSTAAKATTRSPADNIKVCDKTFIPKNKGSPKASSRIIHFNHFKSFHCGKSFHSSLTEFKCSKDCNTYNPKASVTHQSADPVQYNQQITRSARDKLVHKVHQP